MAKLFINSKTNYYYYYLEALIIVPPQTTYPCPAMCALYEHVESFYGSAVLSFHRLWIKGMLKHSTAHKSMKRQWIFRRWYIMLWLWLPKDVESGKMEMGVISDDSMAN